MFPSAIVTRRGAALALHEPRFTPNITAALCKALLFFFFPCLCAGSEGQITNLSLSVRIIQMSVVYGCPSLQPGVTPLCRRREEERGGKKNEAFEANLLLIKKKKKTANKTFYFLVRIWNQTSKRGGGGKNIKDGLRLSEKHVVL